ncbi:hypothetical protein OU5_5019 [Pseudomonas mandelii JR-1]|uniref:Uncharacterized protein n=1 Tax=Pseudomonas mandelii JR-1 TaxID=1147786 RepID=A0A024EIB4_9PSED|nr:hypothetical protein OU5_5019 [Pseudomonas mandelii JR-1]
MLAYVLANKAALIVHDRQLRGFLQLEVMRHPMRDLLSAALGGKMTTQQDGKGDCIRE